MKMLSCITISSQIAPASSQQPASPDIPLLAQALILALFIIASCALLPDIRSGTVFAPEAHSAAPLTTFTDLEQGLFASITLLKESHSADNRQLATLRIQYQQLDNWLDQAIYLQGEHAQTTVLLLDGQPQPALVIDPALLPGLKQYRSELSGLMQSILQGDPLAVRQATERAWHTATQLQGWSDRMALSNQVTIP